MDLPGGLAMADLGPDRDGLTLDRLHVPLGPVLPDWPAGLVVRLTLQGDVIQEAAAEVLDLLPEGRRDRDASVPAAVWELDALGRFLGVAGWASTAARCRGLRDQLLSGSNRIDREADALLARVGRSRLLRWSVRGIRAGSQDLEALLDRRLDRVRAALDDPTDQPGQEVPVRALPGLMVGAELAAARLIVAAMNPQTDSLDRAGEAVHG